MALHGPGMNVNSGRTGGTSVRLILISRCYSEYYLVWWFPARGIAAMCRRDRRSGMSRCKKNILRIIFIRSLAATCFFSERARNSSTILRERKQNSEVSHHVLRWRCPMACSHRWAYRCPPLRLSIDPLYVAEHSLRRHRTKRFV